MWLFKERLRFGSTDSSIGIVTLWTEQNAFDFVPDTLFSVMGNLYNQHGEGVAAIARNILSHPHIRTLVVCGKDKSGSKKSLLNWEIADSVLEEEQDAINWLRENITIVECTKENLIPELQKHAHSAVPLIEPRYFPLPERADADIFPSEITGMRVMGLSIDEAWRKALFLILRYGHVKMSHYGQYKELLNFVTVIDGQRPDVPFTQDEAEQYLQDWENPELPPGISYTYPNRLYKHFQQDEVAIAVSKLTQDPGARYALINLWDFWQGYG